MNYFDFFNFELETTSSIFSLLRSALFNFKRFYDATYFFLFRVASMLLLAFSVLAHCCPVATRFRGSNLTPMSCSAWWDKMGSEFRLCTLAFLLGEASRASMLAVKCWMKRFRKWLAALPRILCNFSEHLSFSPSSILGFRILIEKVGLLCDPSVSTFTPALFPKSSV